jgi:hypothetical protein
VFGSIFTNRLTDQLASASLPPALQKIVAGGGRLTGAMVEQMPPAARLSYERAYVNALTPVFLVAACIAFLGFLLSWLLPEKPLRATAATSTGLEDGLAAPKAPDSLAEIERQLSQATTLDERRRFRGAVAERAGVDVSPGGVWALARMDDGLASAIEAAQAIGVGEDRIAEVVSELRGDGLVDGDGLTARGIAYTDQLLSARRDMLSELLDDPEAERRPEVADLLRALASEMAGRRP